MKWHQFRVSNNVEDYTDINKPVENKPEPYLSITETINLTNSQLAKDAGSENINNKG
jgi:hypothetical protein